MKSLISVAFGATALVTAAIGAAAPADARSDVGVYVGPSGLGINVSDYRYRCRDYWFRREHPYRCGYGRYEGGYYPTYNYDYRYHRRHDWDRDRDWDRRRHHDRDHDRDRW